MIFWSVRRRQRRVRRELVRDIRAMLSQRVKDKLERVLTNARPPDTDLSEDDRRRLTDVVHAVWEISAAVDAVSVESLSVWRKGGRSA